MLRGDPLRQPWVIFKCMSFHTGRAGDGVSGGKLGGPA